MMTFKDKLDFCNSEIIQLTDDWFRTCKPSNDELAGFQFWREQVINRLNRFKVDECMRGLKRMRQLYDSIIQGKVIQEELI